MTGVHSRRGRSGVPMPAMARAAAVGAATAAIVLSAALSAVPAERDAGFFDASADGDVLLLVPTEGREVLAESLLDAGRNWSELAAAVRSLEGDERAACVGLLADMPHLDRLEMPAQTLVEHVRYAFKTLTDMPYEVPGDMFEPYILTYRIGEEPVDAWRRDLHDRFVHLASEGSDPETVARALNAEIASAVVEREKEFFGPTQSPLFTLGSGSGTGAEISILVSAALKSLGIPSRQVEIAALGSEASGTSWVEVFAGDEWLPLYPLEPEAFGDTSHIEREHWRNVTVASTRSAFEVVLVTERYTETGTIELSFVADGAAASEFEHFSVCVVNGGALMPLDALEAVADEEGRFTAVVGNGRYVVLAGTRDAGGRPFVMMREVTLAPGAVKRLAFDVSLDDRERAFDPAKLKRYEGSIEAWIAFDLDQEPSRRMLPLIAGALRRRHEQVSVTYLHMGPDSEGATEARETLGADAVIRTFENESDWYYMDESDERVAIGSGGAELPVVRLYARYGGDVILHNEGYDLNIERMIAGAVDDYLEELLTK